MFILSILICVLSIVGYFFFKNHPDTKSLSNKTLGIGLSLSIIILITSFIVTVPSGSVGVETIFGVVQGESLESGIHLINPFAHIEKMNVQTQSYTMSSSHDEGQVKGDDGIEVLTSDGLTLKLEMTVQYRLLSTSAPQVYKTIGNEYVEKIVRPEIRSVLRDKAVNYVSNDLYSAKREEFISNIKSELDKVFKGRGIVLEGVLLRDVQLPQTVKESINAKISAQQDAQKMEFVLQKEKQEADRKRIEAQGIADFQKIVSEGISDKLLQWRGIQATEELAKSDNAKMVIIGNPKNGLPLVLGQ